MISFDQTISLLKIDQHENLFKLKSSPIDTVSRDISNGEGLTMWSQQMKKVAFFSYNTLMTDEILYWTWWWYTICDGFSVLLHSLSSQIQSLPLYTFFAINFCMSRLQIHWIVYSVLLSLIGFGIKLVGCNMEVFTLLWFV